MAASTVKMPIQLKYIDKTFTNVAINSDGGFVLLGNFYTDFGIPNGSYILSYYVRGWSSAPGTISLYSSNDGKAMYLACSANGTITSVTVRAFYIDPYHV